MALRRTFVHEASGVSVRFEDDGRVAWAFLHSPEGDVIGDVWLYNVGAAPDDFDFSRQAAPFRNAKAFAAPLPVAPPTEAEDVEVRWSVDGELLLADVSLRGELLGRLSPGSQPGWARLARVDGPLARVLAGP